mmetsp:Transcript_7818/g.17409  ORF Transcript_7818/g.17409 Transcript_7818/m.17409 type:complete len:188 (-) Transcript_7818:126-689(-)
MSIIVIDRHTILPSGIVMHPRKRVRFSSSSTPVTKVWEITHQYPSGFFYTRSETDRFRMEARAAKLGTNPSSTTYPSPISVQSLLNMASSSIIVVTFIILGIVATTIACLPILLGLKIASVFIPDTHPDSMVDSSIFSSAPSEHNGIVESTPERLVSSMLDTLAHTCTSGGSSMKSEKRYYSQLLGN